MYAGPSAQPDRSCLTPCLPVPIIIIYKENSKYYEFYYAAFFSPIVLKPMMILWSSIKDVYDYEVKKGKGRKGGWKLSQKKERKK